MEYIYIYIDIEEELLREDRDKLKSFISQNTYDEKMVEYISKNDIDDFEVIRALRNYNEFLKNN